jgi:VanZ family protein
MQMRLSGVQWLVSPVARRGWLLLLVILILTICWLAFSPAPPRRIDTGWDKANHALAFAVLAFTAEMAFWPVTARRRLNVLGLLTFGVFIEVVQSGIPGRSADALDVLADGVGITLGLTAIALLAWLLFRPDTTPGPQDSLP